MWTGPLTQIETEVPLEQTVQCLLLALRTNDTREVFRQLYAFTTNSERGNAVSAVSALPRSTISAIFLTLDPAKAGSEVDPTHGMYIAEYLQDYSSVPTAYDNLGIRRVYQFLLEVLKAFVQVLQHAQITLLPCEITVLLRCAGATSDTVAAKQVWQLLDGGLISPAETRNAALYDEFIKARFLIDPMYFQHDFDRLRFRPRNKTTYRTQTPTTPFVKSRLEKARLQTALRKRFMYGTAPRDPTRDLHWMTNLPIPLNKIWKSMYGQGVMPSDKLLATYVTALGRVGRIQTLYKFIEDRFDLTITNPENHSLTEFDFKAKKVSGRRPIRAAPRLLEALIKALASLGLVVLARRLLEAIVAHHRLKVSPNFWTEFLSHAYVSSTDQARSEWHIYSTGRDPNHQVEAEDVIEIWDTMTSDPHNVEPTFEDLDKYVRSLIKARRFGDALTEMRNGVAAYRRHVDRVSEALVVRLYPSSPPSAHHDFLRQKATQHVLWYNIMSWGRMWLWKTTSRGFETDSVITEQIIPDFVKEFKDFMPNPITYRTQTGLVHLSDQEPDPKYDWEKTWIRTKPTSILRPDRSSPRLTEDGEAQLNDTGMMLYHKTHNLSYRHEYTTVRRRRRRHWEKVGLEAACLKLSEEPGSPMPILNRARAVGCVLW